MAFIIPPMMTLLDDYQAEHKLKGVRVVSLMLHTIPQKIQLSKSLKTGLSHLSDPEMPTLVRLVISTWLNLALKVDEPNLLELFDHLSTLVGTGIIEGMWIYSIQNLVAMKAALDALPNVLRTLSIATASFLKVHSAIFQTVRALKNSVGHTSTHAYNGNAKHYARTTRKHQ